MERVLHGFRAPFGDTATTLAAALLLLWVLFLLFRIRIRRPSIRFVSVPLLAVSFSILLGLERPAGLPEGAVAGGMLGDWVYWNLEGTFLFGIARVLAWCAFLPALLLATDWLFVDYFAAAMGLHFEDEPAASRGRPAPAGIPRPAAPPEHAGSSGVPPFPEGCGPVRALRASPPVEPVLPQAPPPAPLPPEAPSAPGVPPSTRVGTRTLSSSPPSPEATGTGNGIEGEEVRGEGPTPRPGTEGGPPLPPAGATAGSSPGDGSAPEAGEPGEGAGAGTGEAPAPPGPAGEGAPPAAEPLPRDPTPVREAAPPGSAPGEDLAYWEAIRLVRAEGRASLRLLQERLHVGYFFAARLMDRLEKAGVVSPPDGEGRRRVLPDGGGEGTGPSAAMQGG